MYTLRVYRCATGCTPEGPKPANVKTFVENLLDLGFVSFTPRCDVSFSLPGCSLKIWHGPYSVCEFPTVLLPGQVIGNQESIPIANRADGPAKVPAPELPGPVTSVWPLPPDEAQVGLQLWVKAFESQLPEPSRHFGFSQPRTSGHNQSIEATASKDAMAFFLSSSFGCV